MKTKKTTVRKPLAAKPASSLENKTGSWRTYRPEIDNNKCISCALCSKLCPEGCIVMAGKPKINYDYCKGCGVCAQECPVKAIMMKKDY